MEENLEEEGSKVKAQVKEAEKAEEKEEEDMADEVLHMKLMCWQTSMEWIQPRTGQLQSGKNT